MKRELWVVEVCSERDWEPDSNCWHTKKEAQIDAEQFRLLGHKKIRLVKYVPEKPRAKRRGR